MTFIDKNDKSKNNSNHSVPDYLEQNYRWAYLNPKTVPFLSSIAVVEAILWGNASRLIKSVTQEILPGSHVLQAACVYGRFSCELAKSIGPKGRLTIMDVAPIQLDTAKKRTRGFENVELQLQDISKLHGPTYQTIVCFFLLHEVPDLVKAKIIASLMNALEPGGKIIFVDYHKPVFFHPLKPLMSFVFDRLEPYAKGLWDNQISQLAPHGNFMNWEKKTFFGGLYQKVIVSRPLK